MAGKLTAEKVFDAGGGYLRVHEPSPAPQVPAIHQERPELPPRPRDHDSARAYFLKGEAYMDALEAELAALRAKPESEQEGESLEVESILRNFVDERDSELDRLHCDYRVGTRECEAWHKAVYEMWEVLGRLKRPALAWLASRATPSKTAGGE